MPRRVHLLAGELDLVGLLAVDSSRGTVPRVAPSSGLLGPPRLEELCSDCKPVVQRNPFRTELGAASKSGAACRQKQGQDIHGDLCEGLEQKQI